MNEEELRAQLSGLNLPDLRWYEQIDSTNTAAMAWAAAGAADGSLVAADQQSAGRGRLNRKWVTQADSSLAFSLVIRPTAREREHIALFSPLGALGVASALRGLGLQPEIKWPNDILLQRRKVSGILVESVWMGQELEALIVGIGVNVAISSVPPAGDLLFPADCVGAVLGKPVERVSLLREILLALFGWRSRLDSQDFQDVWQSQLAFIGENVWVTRIGEPPLNGVCLGVDALGGLRLRLQNGDMTTVLVGDVSLRPHEEARGAYVG
jgi:BirA family transcriptional regulator, biotin operon repressor / biotin---[acetyl-CoA-carboxylase] ligase